METKQSTTADKMKSKILTSGLHNMGNTCYMNSALQVIVNLKVFHEYFVTKHMHRKQTNLKNPLGYSGDLVNEFGDLIELMY
jgi:ubiquitin C-terminal hydrolase